MLETDSLMFSRSDKYIGGMNLSWIDRMYVSDALLDCEGGIVAGLCMSDHALVVVSFGESDDHGSLVMCIPESIQLDESLVDHIGEIWGRLSWDQGTRVHSLS